MAVIHLKLIQMDSLLPCQRWWASVMHMQKQHFKAAPRLPAETKLVWHSSHNVDRSSLCSAVTSTVASVNSFSKVTEVRYSPVNEQLGSVKAKQCFYLLTRSAQCSHNIINNPGVDEHCPVADGNNTYSLRSELTHWCLRKCACGVSEALPKWDEQLG